MKTKLKFSGSVNRLKALKNRHATLEASIAAEEKRPLPDAIVLQRLKRIRLAVKEKLTITARTLSRKAIAQAA